MPVTCSSQRQLRDTVRHFEGPSRSLQLLHAFFAAVPAELISAPAKQFSTLSQLLGMACRYHGVIVIKM